jgi:hypothetical protein
VNETVLARQSMGRFVKADAHDTLGPIFAEITMFPEDYLTTVTIYEELKKVNYFTLFGKRKLERAGVLLT